MFKNAQIYRLAPMPQLTAENLAALLQGVAFAPCTPNQAESAGFAPVRGHDAPLCHGVHGQLFLSLCVESKRIPGEALARLVREKCHALEEVQGFAPGKKATKEIREYAIDEMMPSIVPVRAHTLVWLDPVAGWLVVDASSPAKADTVIKLLLKAVDRFPIESLRVQRSPVAMMTAWLETDEAPHGFTIDQDATMRAVGESKAEVSFKRHALDVDELRRHIATGKQCVRLALTWRDKVSFVLTENLTLKGVKALDVLTENLPKDVNEVDRWDNDAWLMAAELRGLFVDLVEALGGEAEI